MKPSWTNAEVKRLTELFATAPREQIEAALPRRRWPGIRSYAVKRLGLRRQRVRKLPEGRGAGLLVALRKERERRGLSYFDVAAMVSINPTMLRRWERGKNKPNFTNLMKWASCLRMVVIAARAA